MKFIFFNNIRPQLKTLYARQVFTVFFACVLAVSMTFSPFLLSIGMWGLVAAALWQSAVTCRAEGRVASLNTLSAWWKILAWSFQNLFARLPLALFTLLLLVPALSFFWSADQVYWLERTRVRLPFLVLPWAFANLPRLEERQLRLLLYVLVWTLVFVSIGATVNFVLHFDAVMDGIGRGQPIPVPRSHIRFSLMLVVGIVSGAWLWLQGFYWRWRWERRALAAAVVFLFLFVHLLSARSGIAGLYMVAMFSIGWFVWRSKRWAIGLAALVAMLALPIVAMETLPSFRQRMHYMVWDWQQYDHNADIPLSDSERWVSLQVGIQLWRENPAFGTGAGDLPRDVKRVAIERFPTYAKAPKLPHNQFVYILAGTGLLGFALSLVAFFAPLTVGRYRRFYLFAMFQVLAFSSFLVEYTIETAIGVAFYLFYTLWFMKMAEEDA